MKKALGYVAILTALLTGQSLAGKVTEPIRTQYADIGDKMEFKLGWQSFKGMEVDEMEDLEGWTAMGEFSMPFADKFRLRLSYPFKTDAEATVKDDQPMQQGEAVDVEGNGGVYDFLTLTFEHQLVFARDTGYNLSYYVNGGRVPGRLHTTKRDLKDPSQFDPMNHTGLVFGGGARFDRVHSFGQLLANVGLRYYTDSDDLHPEGDSSFPALDAKLAIVFSPWGALHPAVEVTYLGDFSSLNQFSVIPQLLYTYKTVDLKAGAEIGVGGTGNELGAVLQASIRF
ncbi:MAG TPA: hypothetical protein EYP34_02290 [Chromatiaceae bacterium]|nr:hypothetical protein [Chromatiaceae bacterium]